ncbi:hypothetical protein B0H12DRAFT_1096239 [Mycena haematopus]|nr:hypothetical protein B0H12DRAFT_1096239 [Mycena haematopus]
MPTQKTILDNLRTLVACMRRHAKVYLPKNITNELNTFVHSAEITRAVQLSTNIRPKPIATSHDLDEMIRHVWNDQKVFATLRSKVQFNCVNTIAALTSQRPGAIIESSSYRGTNECLQWQDVEFIVVPNSDDPAHPRLVVGLLFRYLKGRRGKVAHFLRYMLVLEPAGRRATCVVSMLLYLAFEDGIFEDVHNIEAILFPRFSPTSSHTLAIKTSHKEQPVFRSEEVVKGVYEISDVRALTASRHNYTLNKTAYNMGYKVNVSMYVWRRGASNNFNTCFKGDLRDALLNHRTGGKMFASAYQTRSHAQDFGAVLHGREDDEESIRSAQTATTMSVDRDRDAPTALDLCDLAELDREPEMVVMRATKTGLRAAAATIVLSLKSLSEDAADDEARANLHGDLRTATLKLKAHMASYRAIRARELRTRMKTKRELWYKGTSRRQLTGEAQSARKPLNDKTVNAVVPYKHRVVDSSGKENIEITSKSLINMSPINPQDALFDVLYHSADPCLRTEVAATVDMYLGLPKRRYALCYPGEYPTADEKCPGCGEDCRRGVFNTQARGNSIGGHIHECHQESLEKSALQSVVDSYQPQGCFWSGCSDAEACTTFASRDSFVNHVRLHLDEMDRDSQCQWLVEEDHPCDDSDIVDWLLHLAREHNVNVRTKIQVNYCVICPEWTIDSSGDGMAWEAHLWRHYEDQFQAFDARADDQVNLTPIGVEFTAAIDNAVEYENGTGFNGALPEFHGEIVDSIPLSPMHCPCCVFDATLEIVERMRQFTSNESFFRHLGTHDASIEDDNNLCPVPSCGTHNFSRFDLETHLIAFHRVPLFSTTRATAMRRLKLPPPPTLPDATRPVIDLAHLHDQDTGPDTDRSQAKPLSIDIQRKLVRQATAAPPVHGWCYGCSKQYDDIGKHLAAAAKCWAKNKYSPYEGNVRSKKKLSWKLAEDQPPPTDSLKTHFCLKCRKQVNDILQHVDEVCPFQPTTFAIRTSKKGDDGKWTRKNGDHLSIAEWRTRAEAITAGPANAPTALLQPQASGSSTTNKRLFVEISSDEDEDVASVGKGKERVSGSSKRARRIVESSADENEHEYTSKGKGKDKAVVVQLSTPSRKRAHIIISSDEDDDVAAVGKGKKPKRPYRPHQPAIRLNEQPDPVRFLCGIGAFPQY